MKISELDLLAVKTLAGTSVFVVTSIVCIQLIARNNEISDGVTIFASGFFALILAVLGVNGWQAIQKRKTEWEPSQEVKDQIQMARMLKPPDGPVVQPFVPVDGTSVNASGKRIVPVPVAPVRAAGVKPSDPSVVAGIEAIAAKQSLVAADGLPYKGVPDDAPESVERADEGGGLG